MLGLLARTVVLFAAGGVAGVAFNAVRSDAVAFEPQAAAVTCEAEAVYVATMHPADAAALCADPSVVILDARAGAEFARGHVADAIHLPCRADRLSTELEDRLATASIVLVYGASTEAARPVAEALAVTHGDVRVIDGGFAAWEAAGQACSSGPCLECEGEGL